MKKEIKKTSLQNELTQLANYLSGEEELRKKEKKVEELKKEAIERQKDIRRKKITKKEAVLEKEDITEKKVIQKIKLYQWEAPIRFKFPLDIKSYMITVGLSMIFVVYLAVLGHFGLMAALIALLFYVYIAGTTEPVMVTHSITTRGIETFNKLYEWFMLDEFWFTNKDDEYLLTIKTKLRFPGSILMLVGKKDMSAIFVLLEDKLLYKDIKKQGYIEKKSYGEYIPLEKI